MKVTKAEIEQAGTSHTPEVARKPPMIKLSEDENHALKIEIDGDFSRIMNKQIGNAVAAGLIGQISCLGSPNTRVDENASNMSLGFVDSMQPRDSAEALLLTQMAAIHHATMMLARRLNHVENIPQQDAAERALNKLARTYTAQVDTLKRYRSNGQTVRVERVTVENGGQAIVGSVTKGGA